MIREPLPPRRASAKSDEGWQTDDRSDPLNEGIELRAPVVADKATPISLFDCVASQKESTRW
jgi:hypothetical protein